MNTQTLTHSDPQKKNTIYRPTQDKAVGGHLYKIKDDGSKAGFVESFQKHCNMWKRTLHQLKEILAIVYCLNVRYLVLGAKLVIVTDNHALTFLKIRHLLTCCTSDQMVFSHPR